MYIQEIAIEIESDVEKDLIIDEFSWLLAQYHRSGQVLSGSHTQFINGKRLIALPYTLERDSLSKKYNNSYVNKQTKRIEQLCQAKLHFRTIGSDYEKPTIVCSCKKPSGFNLSALAFNRDSPIYCADCDCSIPLYKLPKMEDDSFVGILNWQLNTMICDGFETINMDKPEFASVNSDMLKNVIKQGEIICKKIETLTGTKARLKSSQPEKKNIIETGTEAGLAEA